MSGKRRCKAAESVWRAVASRLPDLNYLVDLGVNAIELMPMPERSR
jgi:1,4-alpha-glucan branching enzyme